MIGKETKTRVLAVDLGYLEYVECWAIQREVHLARTEGRLPDSILIVEHPHVLTVGRNGSSKEIHHFSHQRHHETGY